MLLDRHRSALLVVDMQARLVPAIHEAEAVTARVRLLLDAARQLGVPVLASEQYPKGLGPTIEPVAALLPEGAALPKTTFSCARDPRLMQAIKGLDREQLVVCGVEAHVCVLQSAIELQEQGFAVHVAADAVGSRQPLRRDLGLARMRHAGCVIVDTEMAVFEWLREAGSDEFRALSRLVK
jgi:nicotinamidase-related amidase